MATTTSNLGLIKPDYTDAADVGVINGNFDLIDKAIAADRVNNVRYTNVHNLLDNSDFRNPVNQRGASSYTGSVYGIDRWRQWSYAYSLTVNNGYITNNGPIQQSVEHAATDAIYTAAACDVDGNVHVLTGNPTNAPNDGVLYLSIGSNGFVTIGIYGGDWVWAALYEGEYTAENLPPYVPKGYAAELAECLIYCQRITMHVSPTVINSTTRAYYVPFYTRMRAQPTVTINSAIERNNWTDTTATAIVNSTYHRGCLLYCQTNAEIGPAYWLDCDILVSADL